jgi:hypothetical protein
MQRRYICTDCMTRWTTAERVLPETVTAYDPADWAAVAQQLKSAKLTFQAIADLVGKPRSSVHLALSPKEQRRGRERAAEARRDPMHQLARRVKRPLYESRNAPQS